MPVPGSEVAAGSRVGRLRHLLFGGAVTILLSYGSPTVASKPGWPRQLRGPMMVCSSFPGVAAYAASKSGLIGLTQTLAAEFGPQNIRVEAILSGAVDTDMYREMNDTPDKMAFIANLHALKRLGRPEEIARSVRYLASDDSAFVTVSRRKGRWAVKNKSLA